MSSPLLLSKIFTIHYFFAILVNVILIFLQIELNTSWYFGLGLFLLIVAGLFYQQKKGKSSHSSFSRSILSQYTTDLTEQASRGKLDPVVGRAEEIERLTHILSRRRKNNPLLIGEPGVGKTAVVEGLALRIAQGQAPISLSKKRVLMLDLPGMISGTKYRGEFEERMRKLTQEIQSMAHEIILFIDEVHMLEEAAGAEGGMNVSDILKPALARGDLQAIGATSWKEYEKFIRPDDALNRRFQPVLIGEPSAADTMKILEGTRKVYEDYHRVCIDDSALQEAVRSSSAIQGRFLPDKAFDLIDEACAKVAIDAVGVGQGAPLGVIHGACVRAKDQVTEETGGSPPSVTAKDVQEVIKDWVQIK